MPKSSAHPGNHWLFLSPILSISTLVFAAAITRQGASQTPQPSSTQAVTYFTKGALDGFTELFSEHLRRIGEPSLLAAAQTSTSSVQYRLDWLSARGRLLVVRLSLNSDGTATINSIEGCGEVDNCRRRQTTVVGSDAQEFAELVKKSEFWSMPTSEPESTATGQKRAYKLDASTWVFEGARDGHYHVVLRSGPERSSFTDMVHFLVKDLAKLDDSVVPRASSAR